MSFSHKKLYVIFPAAGSGTRMKSDKNKLLMEVGGIPVIDRTLTAFRKFAVYICMPGRLDSTVITVLRFVSFFSFIIFRIDPGIHIIDQCTRL